MKTTQFKVNCNHKVVQFDTIDSWLSHYAMNKALTEMQAERKKIINKNKSPFEVKYYHKVDQFARNDSPFDSNVHNNKQDKTK